MELLSNPKTEYSLDAGFDSLHSESLDWRKEISFWQDEMVFFYKLLRKKGLRESFPSKELAAIERKLVGIIGDNLDRIKNEVQSHERSLALSMRTISLQEKEKYRQAHQRLLNEVYDMHAVIRNFKEDVFDFVQQYQL